MNICTLTTEGIEKKGQKGTQSAFIVASVKAWKRNQKERQTIQNRLNAVRVIWKYIFHMGFMPRTVCF